LFLFCVISVNHVFSTEENVTTDGPVLFVQMAFCQYQDVADVADSVGFYLLTDGKPDTSMSLVTSRVAEMNADRNIVVNTISFNCPDR